MRKVTLILALMALVFSLSSLEAQEAEVLTPVAFGELPSLQEAAEAFAAEFAADNTKLQAEGAEISVPNQIGFAPNTAVKLKKRAEVDPLRQIFMGAGPTPAPLLTFDGTSDDDNAAVVGSRIVPPDTEGDVGLQYYFQMNNVVFDIFDKTTGVSALPFGVPALPNNLLWSPLGPGSICNTNNDGDPIVLFDHEAERWFVSQFAVGPNGHQCIAVSQTSDPFGAYYLYDFVITVGGLNDYPKLGVWPDGYYMSINEFAPGFVGAAAVAFEKPAMLVGDPLAQGVKFTLPFTGLAPVFFSLQPAHWEGMNAPAAGAPNTFVQSFDDFTWGTGTGPDGYYLWDFAVDWVTPASSTFTIQPFLPTVAFDADMCGYAANCVDQPAPGTVAAGNGLATLSQFTMFRSQYRNFSSYETLVLNHTVDVTGADLAGVRWTELRRSGGGAWSVYQTGTYSPDSDHRWMGSAAMDSAGSIALGYSVSSLSTIPSVRYTSRMDGDPLGVMTGGEISCHEGTGVQINSANRWGDYSSMSVDPVDDCTFWYTQEYYQDTGSFDFNTRICAFRFADCQKGFCGNNVVDLGETCDGTDLNGETCVSQGFDGGTLTCDAGCTGFDTSACFTCRKGDGKGVWNLPAGPSLGHLLGSLYLNGTQVYEFFATLKGSAIRGEFEGTLRDGNAPDPDYKVVGVYENGTFKARIISAVTGNVVGTIKGTYNDNPSLPIIGSFHVTHWEICE